MIMQINQRSKSYVGGNKCGMYCDTRTDVHIRDVSDVKIRISADAD